MTTAEKTKKKNFTFKAEIESLLDLLTNYLYSNPEIFLRELVSNATDALSKIKFQSLTNPKLLGPQETLKIELDLDEKKKTFTIFDNGIGMSEDELATSLGTIAKSGTAKFLQSIKEQAKTNQASTTDLIGKFGVGFYSVFMVAEEVVVESRSVNEQADCAYRWSSTGKGSFSIEQVAKTFLRGTKISFTFKEQAAEMASVWRIKQVVQQHSNFVPFPIELNKERINSEDALWVKDKSKVTKQEYQKLFEHLSQQTSEPQFTYHYQSDAPMQFKAVLFVPSEVEKAFFQTKLESQVHLYSRKVFIQNDCKELFPNWLRFINGVVDSYDLPLNVSRQSLQDNPILAKIRNFLVKKLISQWKKLPAKDPAEFNKFWKNFGIFIKEGIYSDFALKDDLVELFHAYSSKCQDDSLVSLAEYLKRAGPDQKEIYYIQGKNREQIEASPNLEYFRRNDIEVLYLYDDVDEFVINSIHSFQEKPIVSVDKADLNLGEKSAEANSQDSKKSSDKTTTSNQKITKLTGYFKDLLGEKVADVIASKRLVDSPCTLVSKKDAPSAHMEKIMKMMNQDFSETKKIMEINASHPIMKNLAEIQAKFPQDATLKETIELLYDNCLSIERNIGHDAKMYPKVNDMLQKTTSIYLKSLK